MRGRRVVAEAPAGDSTQTELVQVREIENAERRELFDSRVRAWHKGHVDIFKLHTELTVGQYNNQKALNRG